MESEIIIRFLLAALWGGIVGMEREYRSKSAGFRTMIMISVGSCFFTMMSIYIGTTTNPDRIASNIVTGIGFLGAGVIFRGDNRVNGITTAATIWAVAAVGMGIGCGHYLASSCASILILIILAILPYVEAAIDKLNQTKNYSIECAFSENIKRDLEDLLRQHHLHFKLYSQVKENATIVLRWSVQGRAANHDQFIDVVLHDARVTRFEY